MGWDRFALPRSLRVLLLGSLLITLGCRRSGLDGCSELIAAERWADAVARCEQVYAAEGEPLAGAAAARAHYQLGNQERVLAWAQRLQGTTGEPRTGSLVAGVHWQRGEMELAEGAYRRDLELTRAADDAEGMARPLYGLFYLAWSGSRYREALELVTESFAQAERAGDREAQARAAEGLFTVLYDVGDRVGARQALEMAADLRERPQAADRARYLVNEGLLLRAEGRPVLGIARLEQAVKLLAGSADHRTLRSAHLDLVELCLEAGELERAEGHLRSAWEHREPQAGETALLYFQAAVDRARGRLDEAARSLAQALAGEPVPEWAWDLELLAGEVAEAKGDAAAAEAAYERAVRVVEEMREALALSELKPWLLERKRRPFESLFLLQARSGRAREALQTAERALAQSLLDAVIEAATRGRGVQPAGDALQAAERVEALRAILPAMRASLTAQRRPLEEVLAAFGGRRALVFFQARDELWLLVVGGGEVGLRPLGAAAGRARQLAERLQAAPDEAAAAAELGELLLPVGALPPPGTTIHLVVDGVLAQVPFAVVRHGAHFLVEEHPLVHTPSLTVWSLLAARPDRARGRAVVLADPRGDLPAAAVEGAAVARSTGAVLHTARQASAAALTGAAHAPLLHAATHSGLGARGPWLRLADGDVGAGEIVGGGVGPRLVVLASCASAARAGRETWGSLATAFLAAGSRGVVAALGSVEDAAARRFVERFYAAGGAEDPASALAAAQRGAIAAGEPPRQWAPFVLLGGEVVR